jgi:hypothetical protein
VVVVVVANRSINQSDSGRCAAAWTLGRRSLPALELSGRGCSCAAGGL